MTRRFPQSRSKKTDSASRDTARKIVDELIEQEPRLKVAREASRAVNGEECNIAQQSLRNFRQRLKDN